jgi:hypothetical protein
MNDLLNTEGIAGSNMEIEDHFSIGLREILESIWESRNDLRDGMRLFAPMTGARWNGGLMFVGRALYGWPTPSFKATELDSMSFRERMVQESWKISRATPACPILRLHQEWQDGLKSKRHAYNPSRSQFWMTIRSISQRSNICDDGDLSWHSRLHWSNLYKINPECTGNPDEVLKIAQEKACRKLLELEIQTLRPKAIIFLSGWNGWAERFIPSMAATLTLQPNNPNLHAYGKIIDQGHESTFAVTPRPARKKREPIISAVLELIGKG